MRYVLAIFAALVVGCSASEASSPPESVGASSPATPPSSTAPAAPNATSADAGGGTSAGDAGGGGADAAVDAAPPDPCPNLPIPTKLFNRNVVYREWSPTAVGDGTYFTSQAPLRLGFNRTQNTLWLAKIRTDKNTYVGRVAAYGDNSGGIAWVSDRPDDVTFAVQHKTATYGVHGGGTIFFVVVDGAADAQRIATDPAFATYKSFPQLESDHCYYVGFENTQGYPQNVDASFWSSPDDCGANGDGTCYYLAFDFFHLLYDPSSGKTLGGSVIPGLTH